MDISWVGDVATAGSRLASYTQAAMDNPLVLAEIARAQVFFAHDSVGEDILDGLRVLTAPCKVRWTSRRVGRNGDPIGKIDGFCRAMIEGPGRDAPVAIFKLSYADF